MDTMFEVAVLVLAVAGMLWLTGEVMRLRHRKKNSAKFGWK